MKFIKIILAMLVMALSFSSCLESNLKDLPTFDGNDITAGYAWYRYIGEDKINISGQPQVIQKQLQKTAEAINAEAATCNLTFAVPTNFSEKEKNNVNLNNIVVAVQIS